MDDKSKVLLAVVLMVGGLLTIFIGIETANQNYKTQGLIMFCTGLILSSNRQK